MCRRLFNSWCGKGGKPSALPDSFVAGDITRRILLHIGIRNILICPLIYLLRKVLLLSLAAAFLVRKISICFSFALDMKVVNVKE